MEKELMTLAELLENQQAVRDDLCEALRTDLIGPASDEEVLEEAPLDRYVTGILYPALADGNETDPEAQDDTADDDGDRAADPAVAMSNIQYPTSAGISFAVAPEVDQIRVRIEAARYEEMDAGWQRKPIGPEELLVSVDDTVSDRQEVATGLQLYRRVRDVREGARSVTLVLLNTLEGETGNKDPASFFQVSFSVVGERCDTPFVARPAHIDVSDEDMDTNALLYRGNPQFAVGHGCSATWEQRTGTDRAESVAATFLPAHDVTIMESNPDIPSGRLVLDDLAAADSAELVDALESFVAGYSEWIADRQEEAMSLKGKFADTATLHLRDCGEARDRIHSGVEVLRDDADARRAFQLANRAMADQMDQASDKDRSSFKWRPFQLAFVLLSLPSIVDRSHSDRSIAELLWFPAGGGKTEAYLGLFAFTVFHRRISRDGAGGVTAIMRYTLRLLTAQQFERAARVVCACELIRREQDNLGEEPISIGLFVGAASTPNKVKAAEEALKKLHNRQEVQRENPCQLRSCPWCHAGLDEKNYTVVEDPARLKIACSNEECVFPEGLPIFVVDEDLYRERPTLVIGTVDKFAALPWRPAVGNLFNLDDHSCPPPELIIQDELHLISGPLGTMTGLYETAVDLLASEDDAPPKVVASTATIRRAKAQSIGLFAREMRQFPPPGLDPGDSWFATSAPVDRVGARRYVGLMAAGVSHATLMIRAYASLIHNAGEHERDAALDPYWTVVGYFNSLRVLGAARMQVQDDVQDQLEIVAAKGDGRRLVRDPVELTSRVDSGDIPEFLKQMAEELSSGYALDVVLATSMISVGVDVDRLGLMVMMGQPQAAAEYIQATSRVGRKYPGLVVTLLNAARSRDRSHYEGFTDFHCTLYRSVEATSVTPFSPRARDRGLHAVLVALARLSVPGLRGNEDAAGAPAYRAELDSLRNMILARVAIVESDQLEGATADLDLIIERWVGRAEQEPNLRYESSSGKEPALLAVAAPDVDLQESYPTMWSLRDVDVESNLFWRPSL
jgi:Helicase conserved C-terminal domain